MRRLSTACNAAIRKRVRTGTIKTFRTKRNAEDRARCTDGRWQAA